MEIKTQAEAIEALARWGERRRIAGTYWNGDEYIPSPCGGWAAQEYLRMVREYTAAWANDVEDYGHTNDMVAHATRLTHATIAALKEENDETHP